MMNRIHTDFLFTRIALIGTVSVCLLAELSMSSATAQDDDASVIVSFVDSSGDPIPDVKAYWFRDFKRKKLSAGEGECVVDAPRGLVVAHQDGHQYSGIVLDGLDSRDAVVVLRRNDEPGRLRTTRHVPIGDQIRNQILEGIEELYWKRVRENPQDPATVSQCLTLLARFSSQRVAGYLLTNSLVEPYDLIVKRALVQSLVLTDFEIAVEIINGVEEPMSRAGLLFSLLNDLPKESPRLEAIEIQYVDTVRAIPEANYRLAVWAGLADHFLMTDHPEKAQAIVDELIDDVLKLPAGGWSGFPRSLFAALIVEESPNLAKELISGMDGNEKNRALARVAFACCDSNPELAIELLNEIEIPNNTIGAAVYELRVVDPKMIAETLARQEKERHSSSDYRSRERVVELLTEHGDGRKFWDAISLPPFLAWPTEQFEKH